MESTKPAPDPIRVTALLEAAVLEELGVPYFIGGSLASTLHGMVRTTQDSDIVAAVRPQDVEPFVRALQGEFYLDHQMILDAVAQRTSFNIIHREAMFKVDVFIPGDRAFDRAQFERARRETLAADPEVQAFVSTAEDTLLAKLEWYRMGGETSECQWRDALGIAKVQAGALDLDYLRRTAKELGVEDLLERVLREA